MSTQPKGDKRVCVGVVVAAHGVHGRVKIHTYTELPESLTAYGPLVDAEGNPVLLKVTGTQKAHIALAVIEGVTRREHVDKWIGKQLFADASAFPAGADDGYYPHELLGLQVVDAVSGKVVGHVLGLENYGAGDILELALAGGKRELFSFDAATFPAVNLAEGTVSFLRPEEIIVQNQNNKD